MNLQNLREQICERRKRINKLHALNRKLEWLCVILAITAVVMAVNLIRQLSIYYQWTNF